VLQSHISYPNLLANYGIYIEGKLVKKLRTSVQIKERLCLLTPIVGGRNNQPVIIETNSGNKKPPKTTDTYCQKENGLRKILGLSKVWGRSLAPDYHTSRDSCIKLPVWPATHAPFCMQTVEA